VVIIVIFKWEIIVDIMLMPRLTLIPIYLQCQILWLHDWWQFDMDQVCV